VTEQELFALVGKIIAWIASGAGGAFLLIKFMGKKWLENKFSKDLELFKTQKLHEFDLLLTRKTKWHQTEHEVLSASWKKLKHAHNALKGAISMFSQHPDFDRMQDDEFNKFLDRGNFSDSEKDFMKDHTGGRNSAYGKITDHRLINEAHKAFLDFYLYFEENRIFLQPHIKEKFEKVDDYIWSAWVSKKMSLNERSGTRDFLMEAFDKEDKQIKPLINDIENTIQKELFPEQHKKSEGEV
jgi:hypothetical protein